HLFGGEQSLAEQVVQILRGQKLFARAAIADTLGAAWALAHFGTLPRPEVRLPSFTADRGRAAAGQAAANGLRTRAGIVRTSVIVIPPGEHAGALRSLPIEALRLPGDLIGTLQEFDLRRVGQLLALPRTSLPSRFGPF